MLTYTEHLLALSCAMYIVTSVMFAAVRFFHTCPSAEGRVDYFYPDRRMGSLFYLVPVLLLPYALHPGDSEAWLLVSSYYPLTHFFYCAVLLFQYFGKVRRWYKWRQSGWGAAVVAVVPTVCLLVLALWPGRQLTDRQTDHVSVAVALIALVMTLYCLLAIWRVYSWMKEYGPNNYSNPDDFPLAYARSVLIIPFFHIVLIWPMVFLDSPVYLAVVQAVLSVFNVIFLIYVLPPRREETLFSQNVQDDAAVVSTSDLPSPASNVPRQAAMPPQTRDKIVAGIREAVEQQQQYLNPHLTLSDVAGVCGYSHGYVSAVLNDEFGGFFRYVNQLRIQHVDDCLLAHPEITKEEAIVRSGFDNRQAYYRIRKRLSLAATPPDA